MNKFEKEMCYEYVNALLREMEIKNVFYKLFYYDKYELFSKNLITLLENIDEDYRVDFIKRESDTEIKIVLVDRK